MPIIWSTVWSTEQSRADANDGSASQKPAKQLRQRGLPKETETRERTLMPFAHEIASILFSKCRHSRHIMSDINTAVGVGQPL
jgi:hypothetical protein